MERIKTKIAREEYNRITSSDEKIGKGYFGFEKEIKAFKSANASQEQKSEFRITMIYGFGFITMMFLGFLSGFSIGKVILEWDTTNSLILSLFIGTMTMMMEAFLMIIRLYQID